MNRTEIINLIAKFGGIILKKAELEENFDVYSRVFEVLEEIEFDEEFLVVLGEMGG